VARAARPRAGAEAGARSQLLHWFSKSREEAGDRHACFLPPLLARPAALVCRGGRAAGYSTYTLDGSEGWCLPTLHTIFVRKDFRRRGVAGQLLRGFFRPEDRGAPRTPPPPRGPPPPIAAAAPAPPPSPARASNFERSIRPTRADQRAQARQSPRAPGRRERCA